MTTKKDNRPPRLSRVGNVGRVIEVHPTDKTRILTRGIENAFNGEVVTVVIGSEWIQGYVGKVEFHQQLVIVRDNTNVRVGNEVYRTLKRDKMYEFRTWSLGLLLGTLGYLAIRAYQRHMRKGTIFEEDDDDDKKG